MKLLKLPRTRRDTSGLSGCEPERANVEWSDTDVGVRGRDDGVHSVDVEQRHADDNLGDGDPLKC